MTHQDQAKISRREVLEKTAIAAGVAGAIAVLPRAVSAAEAPKLKKGDTVLLQGDSITDAGRDRRSQAHANHPRAMGFGYAMLLG